MKYCLIVEDNQADAFLLQKHLVKIGFITSVCDNVFRALELIRTGKVNVVVTDISIPEIGGLVLIKYIRMVNKSIPIIAVTAHVTDDIRIQAYQNGVDYYITKPYERQDIENIFKNLKSL